jgi:hypothetical protein
VLLQTPLKPSPRIYFSRAAMPFGTAPRFSQRSRFGRYGSATDAFTALYDKVTVCTAATGCLAPIDMNAPSDPETAALIGDLQPAVILTGNAGTKTIAPYGVPNGVSSTFKSAGVGIAAGLALAAVGAVLLIRSF